jgi:hypothetical protein
MRSAALAVLLFFALPVAGQFRFQAVDIAGSVATQVRGINDSGDIVGFYQTASDACIPFAMDNQQVPPCDERGFKIVNGKLTTVMVPASLSTAILGINDRGDMVGYYTKTSEECIVEQHGFLWTREGVVYTLDYPHWTGFCGTDALWTVPFAINNAGTVAGAVWSVLDGQPWGGFLYKNNAFTAVNPTGGDGGCFPCAGVSGISNRGAMVGTAYRVIEQIPQWVAFAKSRGQENFFTRTQDDTWATGINDRGDVVGYGVYGAGFLIPQVGRGEAWEDGVEVDVDLIPIGYPDAVGTYPFAVNNRRIVVGAYRATDGALHGFVAVPQF